MNQNERNEDIRKPYTLRPLEDRDLYAMLGILARIFPGDKLQKALAQLTDAAKGEGRNAEEIGAQVAAKLGLEMIGGMVEAHDEIYALLADMSGMTVEALDKLPFGTGPMMILDIVSEAANADFFKVVFRSR